MTSTAEETPSHPIEELERRQDVVLRELELLEQRLSQLLADYAALPAPKKKVAA